jgi:hypothetical protein
MGSHAPVQRKNICPAPPIVIRSNQPLPGSGSTRSVTAIGTQANTSLAFNGIAVEGLRAQIPDFAAVAQNLSGVATNLQTVKNGTGTSALDVISPALTVTDEYAELTWQDLDFGGRVLVDCDSFPDELYLYDLQVNRRQVLERKMSVTRK